MVHNEINSLAILRSPHIMRLYEVIDEYSKVHLILELCNGVAMNHVLKKGPLTADSCKAAMYQLMKGVQTIHSKGFAHRDLKVENLVYDEDSKQLKIIDFGFALEIKAQTPIKQTCGTPAYMDPDQTRNGMYLPMNADIWACGVIFYLLLTAELPFKGKFDAELFLSIQRGKY